MKTVGPVSRAIAIATLICFAAPQAEAIEVYGAGAAPTQMDDGLLVQVRGGRGGGAPRRRRHAPWRRRHAPRWRRYAGGGYAHRGGMHGGDAQGRRSLRRTRERSSRKRQPECESERQSQCEPERQSKRQRQPPPAIARLRQLVAARLVSVGRRRRCRGRRGARVRQRRGCGVVGRRGSRSKSLLVLYRPKSSAGLLGRLPVVGGARRPRSVMHPGA